MGGLLHLLRFGINHSLTKAHTKCGIGAVHADKELRIIRELLVSHAM